MDVTIVLLLMLMCGVVDVTSKSVANDKTEIIEGDIVLSNEIKELLSRSSGERQKRKVIRGLIHYWSGGKVFYEIANDMPLVNRKALRLAFRILQEKSCIHFSPRQESDKDYVVFVHENGCFSSIGRKGGKQKISLGRGCDTVNRVLHEILHTLGFFHEHSRYDRDKYIKILWWNIVPGMEKNFDSYSHDHVDDLGYPYDYESIMHYGNAAFSLNGRDTIERIGYPDYRFSPHNKLSEVDIKQLDTLYECKTSHKTHECGNIFGRCDKYSLESDACESNFDFMKQFCKKACGFCGLE